MNKSRFLKKDEAAKIQKYMNPVDWYNRHGEFLTIFTGNKYFEIINNTTVRHIPTGVVYNLKDGMVNDTDGNDYTLFEILTIAQFNNSYKDALHHVDINILKKEICFIRVGTDYFKVIYKENRYGVITKKIKGWKKEALLDDYGKGFLKEIPRFDDFTIFPDNLNHKDFIGNFYNLYAKFPHEPVNHAVYFDDFPYISKLMNHIFGDQVLLGYTYMKVLYQFPKQILPILCLVSSERQTGKTSFLNLMEMIFGDNYVLISPGDLSSSFNQLYATKNFIGIDETAIERREVIEKLKAIATQKSMTVNQKFVSQYSVPFFGKIIIATNMVKDFMRIDEEEIRFWVRKVPVISERITDIEERMKDEIPSFLKYLLDMPDIDFTRSRMVFTPEEINNEYLKDVQKESRSGLRKELEILIENVFISDERLDEFLATPTDIKKKWFEHDRNYSIHYITKVLKEEMGLYSSEKVRRYRFDLTSFSVSDEQVGKPFTFERHKFTQNDPENNQKIVKIDLKTMKNDEKTSENINVFSENDVILGVEAPF